MPAECPVAHTGLDNPCLAIRQPDEGKVSLYWPRQGAPQCRHDCTTQEAYRKEPAARPGDRQGVCCPELRLLHSHTASSQHWAPGPVGTNDSRVEAKLWPAVGNDSYRGPLRNSTRDLPATAPAKMSKCVVEAPPRRRDPGQDHLGHLLHRSLPVWRTETLLPPAAGRAA